MQENTQTVIDDAPKKKTDNRQRNWTFIVYPGDSLPEDYVDILDDLHVQWVESPTHDRDINGDGSPKKPHKHIGLFFDGKKSPEQANEIAQLLKGTCVKPTLNARSLIRYFAHLDNPEKAQYSVDGIIAHGGIDVRSLLMPTSAMRYDIVREMMQFCVDADIFEFSDLCLYAMENHIDDWYPILIDHNTIVMQTFLTSRRHKFKGGGRDE